MAKYVQGFTTPPKLFLVDDEPAILRVLSRILRRNGWDTTSDYCGETALQSLRQNPSFDAIITDEQMPGRVQGHDIVDFVITNMPDTPIILMSGHHVGSSHPGGAANPQVAYATKPIRARELLVLLSNGLDWRAMRTRP